VDWSFPFLTMRLLSQYTQFIALKPKVRKHYNNHGLTNQCHEIRNSDSMILSGEVAEKVLYSSLRLFLASIKTDELTL